VPDAVIVVVTPLLVMVEAPVAPSTSAYATVARFEPENPSAGMVCFLFLWL
jgi:hypothetical protein